MYIPISALMLPCAWGASLAQLSRRAEPVRAMAVTAATAAALHAVAGPGAQPDSSSGSRALAAALANGIGGESDAPPRGSSADASRKGALLLGVPKELWRLVDALVMQPGALATTGLFSVRGDAGEIAAVREAIDTGAPLPLGVSPLALGGALLSLLRALREPLVPVARLPTPADAARAGGLDAWAAALLRALPPLHYACLVYLVRFAREVVAASPGEASRADDVAAAFSRAWMRGERFIEAPAHAAHGDTRVAMHATKAVFDNNTLDLMMETNERGADLADLGTRWEPTGEEQDAMTRASAWLINSAQLAT